MSKRWQLRRGTTAENDEFTGAQGELTMDTDTNALRIHDGVTQGGHMIDCVVEWQAPTAENNYTWYRKYSSGWVEQGGVVSIPAQLQATVVNLATEMLDTNYNLIATINALGYDWTAEFDMHAVQTSTTTISLQHGSQINPSNISWRVSGMGAV